MADKKKARIGLGSFDLVKGMAILAVIIGHALQGHPGGDALFSGTLGSLIGSLLWGLMPMFFIISGYGFKSKPVIKMLKKTFAELMVPYLIAIPLATALHFVFFWKRYPNMGYRIIDAEKRIVAFLLGTDSAGPLWFFLALFIASNILNLVLNVRKEWLQVLLVILCIMSSFLIMNFEFRYFRLIEGLSAVGFVYIGYLLKQKKYHDNVFASVWAYILLFVMWLLQFIGMIKGGSGFDMARADYTFLSYVYAGGTGLLIVFCGLLLNRVNWFGKEFITKCGMYSYWILIIHTIDYLAVPWWDLWSENPYPILASVIELGLRILIITLGCEIIKKVTKLRYKKNRNFDSKITHKVSC